MRAKSALHTHLAIHEHSLPYGSHLHTVKTYWHYRVLAAPIETSACLYVCVHMCVCVYMCVSILGSSQLGLSVFELWCRTLLHLCVAWWQKKGEPQCKIPLPLWTVVWHRINRMLEIELLKALKLFDCSVQLKKIFAKNYSEYDTKPWIFIYSFGMCLKWKPKIIMFWIS